MATRILPLMHEAKAIAAFGGRLAFAVSTGRDSAVMLHVMSRLVDIKKQAFFFWSHYPEVLPYHRRYIETVERKYGISIETHTWPEMYGGDQHKFTLDFMERNGCSLCLFGYRMDESLQRRGMLNRFADGIDRDRRWAYPLRSFTKPKVKAYAKAYRVPLNIEYCMGLDRDMGNHRGIRAYYLRHFIGEEDYQCAIRQDRNVEVDYVRITSDPEFWKNAEENIRKENGEELPEGRDSQDSAVQHR